MSTNQTKSIYPNNPQISTVSQIGHGRSLNLRSHGIPTKFEYYRAQIKQIRGTSNSATMWAGSSAWLEDSCPTGTLPLHGKGRRFESGPAHHLTDRRTFLLILGHCFSLLTQGLRSSGGIQFPLFKSTSDLNIAFLMRVRDVGTSTSCKSLVNSEDNGLEW